ncbi:uncharacterized protein LOC133821077 [Humulus lupulus]|uniref:uncharacterized protein LOC133821077 n=1 Tax=Humulus lupulus TaxID=3486 RepID=UPI002B40C171|nr:uncharacterized protein LOC133821077 [Humulus lupulus]
MSTIFCLKRISKRNKEARAKMTIPGGHGAKSIVAHVYDHMDSSTGQLPSMIDTFEHLHKKKDKWISNEAATKQTEMTEHRASQSTTPVSSAASCVGDNVDGQFPPDMDIVTDVLGPRSRYKKGFGGCLG